MGKEHSQVSTLLADQGRSCPTNHRESDSHLRLVYSDDRRQNDDRTRTDRRLHLDSGSSSRHTAEKVVGFSGKRSGRKNHVDKEIFAGRLRALLLDTEREYTHLCEQRKRETGITHLTHVQNTQDAISQCLGRVAILEYLLKLLVS